MAWNDDTQNLRRGVAPRAIDLSGVGAALDQGVDEMAQNSVDFGSRLQSAVSSNTAGDDSFDPAEFALNEQTGEIALPNGQVIKANAPVILQLATLQNDDGQALPRMSPQTMQQLQERGFRPYSHQRLVQDVAAIPTDSDFFGEAWANFKTTVGLAASAVDSMFGNDDPSNSWSRASQEHANDQSIGQLKASQGRWYSGWDSFINGLGQTTGNVTGTLVGAIPAVAASAAGTAPAGGAGGIATAGLALTGGLSTYGEQANDFYASALDAMENMEPETLATQSPLYRQVVLANPGMSHDEAIKEVAIQGSRMAGSAAGVLGAAEALVGAKLAGNFLARAGLSKTLLGPAMQAVEKRAGLAATGARAAGRFVAGGTGAAAEEMAESAIGQSAGAAYTGVGDSNPMSHVNPDEGWAAALGGGIFGLFGGRAHADATQIARDSDLGQALAASPDLQREGALQRDASPDMDLVPAALRRVAGMPASQPGMGPAAPGVPVPGMGTPNGDQRLVVKQQLENVLAERFGPEWVNQIDQIATRAEGRQLLGQLVAIERELASEQEAPAYERRANAGPVDPGQPNAPLQGPAFGDGTAPPPASVPQGEPPAPNLSERRAFQQISQEERLRQSEANPQALPQAASRTAEQKIFEIEDQIAALQEAIAQRPPRDPRKKFLRKELDRMNTLLAQAEEEWQAARLDEGPTGVVPGAQVDAPEPLEAPGERTPDGRPMGVAPPPLANPEPMKPEEAAARQRTQQERAAQAGTVAQAAQSSREQVSPSTPEPAEDVAAQIEALVDPQSARDAVFVAEGNEQALPKATPKGVMRVARPGVGVLLTTNQKKAQEFRTKKLTDAKLQQILGYSENKADVIAKGAEPVVVQARTKKGAVAAEQLTSREGTPAAREAVRKLGPKGAKVVETSVAKAQERRAVGSKGAAVIATSKERSTPAKKTRVHKKKDDDDKTRDERALAQPGAPREAAAPAPATADTIERAATRKAEAITVRAQSKKLPTKLAQRTGVKGNTVDLRADTIDEQARFDVQQILDSETLGAIDREKAEAVARDFDQLETMLDAAVTAAEERLRKAVEKEEGSDFLREAEKRQLDIENKATEGKRGRPRETVRNSVIAYLPLTISEARGFLQALRSESKHELRSGYSPATSVVRHMLGALGKDYETAMRDELTARRVLSVLADLSDEQLELRLQGTHHIIKNATVAKQVMRGATEVAHAFQRAENDTVGSRAAVDFADHRVEGVEAKVLPHVTEHGTMPAAAQGIVNEWIAQFEKGGHKFSAPVHVMSLQDAMRVAPQAFLDNRPVNGKFIRRVDEEGNVTDYILAVNWHGHTFDGAAIETLAHEYGHMVTTELFNRADPRTQRAIIRAYDQWRSRQRGRNVDDILREQMPTIERMTFAGGATDYAYATDFWEWAARNAALYVMDPSRPHVGAIEKFFKTLADVIRALYVKLIGPTPNAAWAEALDRWIAGTLTVSPMPAVDETVHESLAGPREPGTRADNGQTDAIAVLRDLLGKATSREDVQATVNAVTEGKAVDLLKSGGLSLMTLRQIERQYRDTPLGTALSGWVRNQQVKAKTANVAMEAGSQWMERANLLDAKVRSALEQVMYYATHFKVHPDLAFTDAKNAHLQRGSDHVKAINEKRYNHVHDLYNAAIAADPQVAKIYEGLRDSFTELHDKTLAKLLENIENSNFNPTTKEQISERIKSAQRQMREGPYFPLMRFGNWIVKVQLPAHYVGVGGKEGGATFASKTAARDEMRNQRALNPGAQVAVEKLDGDSGYVVRVYQRGVYFFESEAQAKAATKDIEAEVREHYSANGVDYDDAQAAMEPFDDGDGAGADKAIISQPFKGREGYENSKRPPSEFMNEVRSLLDQKKLDPEVAATLERLAVESLPENSYRQSLLPRQNIFGASKQMLKAYAHRYQGAAHHYSVVEHGTAINRNWARAWEVNRTYSPAGRVLNVLESSQKAVAERMKHSMANTVMNTITDLSSIYSLGFSPAYVLTNAMQPWVVTAPALAGLSTSTGSVGMAKSVKYLKDAYSGALPFFTKRGMQDFINEAKALAGKKGGETTLQDTAKEIIGKFGQTPEEKVMLESLLERGTLDFSWLNSLEDAMRGGKVGQKWASLQRLGMAFPQQVEAMNRVTTALAAYRLAKDEKLTDGSEAALQEFADDMVADTQLDYSRMNRPLAFNKAGLNVLLQFKLYLQGMYMLFARNIALAMRGATAEEKRQGKRTVAYLLLSHGAFAGAAGLGPAAAMAKLALVAFAAMSGDDDDDWKSGEQLMHEMLQDLFGDYAGTVAERGLPAILAIDMSDRVGIPNLFDSRYANIREGDTTGMTMDKYVLYSLGAPYANAKRAAQGVSDLAKGDFSSAVNGLPAAARAVARSAKWASEGIVDKDGDTFVPRSELGWSDLAINTLGLTPLATSTAYRDRTELKSTSARIVNERKRLMQAARTGEDVADEIREFNAAVPKPFRISGEQISKAKEAKHERESGALRKNEAAVKKLLDQ